jgi:hypothetical protein
VRRANARCRIKDQRLPLLVPHVGPVGRLDSRSLIGSQPDCCEPRAHTRIGLKFRGQDVIVVRRDFGNQLVEPGDLHQVRHCTWSSAPVHKRRSRRSTEVPRIAPAPSIKLQLFSQHCPKLQRVASCACICIHTKVFLGTPQVGFDTVYLGGHWHGNRIAQLVVGVKVNADPRSWRTQPVKAPRGHCSLFGAEIVLL